MLGGIALTFLSSSVLLVLGWLAGIPIGDERGLIGYVWAGLAGAAGLALTFGY